MRRLSLLCFCLLLSPTVGNAAGLRVAIFGDIGADGEQLLALARTVAAAGDLPQTIVVADIQRGYLSRTWFDVLVLPDGQRGEIYLYEQSLRDLGLDSAIRSFVASGAGFVGIGAGARYAAASEQWNDVSQPRSLGLFDGTAVGPATAASGGMGVIDVDGLARTVFIPNNAPAFSGGSAEPLARYRGGRSTDVENDLPAVVRTSFGSGRVVLVGPVLQLDVRSENDWTRWDDRIARSYDGERDAALLAAWIAWSSGDNNAEPRPLTFSPPQGRRVALFTSRIDTGGAFPALLPAVARNVEYAGDTPLAIRDEEVYWADLNRTRFDALIIPGGYASGYWTMLSGFEPTLRSFVQNGGGYAGISAGAFYAADKVYSNNTPFDYPLDLFRGAMREPVPGLVSFPDSQLTGLAVDDPAFGVQTYTTLFVGEGYFTLPPPATQPCITSATYVNATMPGLSAVVRHSYGSGRAIYPNLHLEVEEGSTSDWVFAWDNDALGPIVDPESEWDLFASMLHWAAPLATAQAPARPSIALASRFGSGDSSGESLAEAQDDDAFGTPPTNRVPSDGRLTLVAGRTWQLAGFGAKTRVSLPEALLTVEYSSSNTFNSSTPIEWRLGNGAWNATPLVLASSQTDAVVSYNLRAVGVDTPGELAQLEVRYRHTGGSGVISFDRIELQLAPDADADGAPDSVDCASQDADSFAPPPPLQLSWISRTRLVWTDAAKGAGEGTVYDVARGSLVSLKSGGTLNAQSCMQTGLPALTVADMPPPGDGSWWLVRARNGCGASSWNVASPPICP